MTVGVMQPYLFPYLGYYQLVYHCEKFVFYDDVNYIKSGYINRNNILTNSQKQLFTLPVEQASSFKKINDLNFHNSSKKILRTIEQAYSKSPYYKEVMPLIINILSTQNRGVVHITRRSIIDVLEYLGIKKETYLSSELEYNRELDAANKLYSICHLLNSNRYCNSSGGQKLYKKGEFANNGIELSFIEMKSVKYEQGKGEFVGNLSIIDVLMWNSKDEVIELLKQYRLV